MMGDEDPADIDAADYDYKILRAKGEKIAKELVQKGVVWKNQSSWYHSYSFWALLSTKRI